MLMPAGPRSNSDTCASEPGHAGLANPARVLSRTVIAEAMMLDTSARLLGTIIVLLVLARLANAPM